MYTRIRRRLAAEEGVSLVETLVAMVLIGGGLLALLSTLTASAASLVDQRARTAATRLAAEHVENLRAEGFEAIQAKHAAGDYASPLTRTVDGRVYTVATAIVERDAETGGAVVAGRATVLAVTSTLSWQTPNGTPISTQYSTAIARDERRHASAGGCAGGGGQSIESINLLPSPTTVGASGQPLQDIEAVVKLCGFPLSSIVQLSWEREGSGTQFQSLFSVDGGITWRALIDRSKVRTAVPEGMVGTLDVTLRAGTLDQLHSLDLSRQAITPLQITDTSISQNPIGVEPSPNNCNGPKCRNLSAVTFTATTVGVDPAADSVKLKYQLVDGTFREVSMAFNATAGHWEHTDPALSVKYKRGDDQPFTFLATRTSPFSTTAVVVKRMVTP